MIEPTDRMRPRPVWARYVNRLLAEHDLLSPTQEEIDDAQQVIAEGPIQDGLLPDLVYIEAMRIIIEAEL